ncbi:MAG: hypothetical protein V3R48_01940, partial [Thermoplasmata archaeon]
GFHDSVGREAAERSAGGSADLVVFAEVPSALARPLENRHVGGADAKRGSRTPMFRSSYGFIMFKHPMTRRR